MKQNKSVFCLIFLIVQVPLFLLMVNALDLRNMCLRTTIEHEAGTFLTDSS